MTACQVLVQSQWKLSYGKPIRCTCLPTVRQSRAFAIASPLAFFAMFTSALIVIRNSVGGVCLLITTPWIF